MRGRTLNDAFVILDEAQNTTVPQMMMFLTRLGEGSRMVVTGDPSQIDLPRGVRSGLHDAVKRLRGVPGIAIATLTAADVVRHPVVQRIIDAYDDRTEDEAANGGARPRDAAPPMRPAPTGVPGDGARALDPRSLRTALGRRVPAPCRPRDARVRGTTGARGRAAAHRRRRDRRLPRPLPRRPDADRRDHVPREDGSGVDLVVSVERAHAIAADTGHAPQNELALYVVHGLLHACGFDDLDAAARREMRAAERVVLDRLGLEVATVDRDEEVHGVDESSVDT
jgi:rRNA maturation RNase YbeY